MWKRIFIVLKILFPIILIGSLGYNIKSCSDVYKYKQLVSEKANIISKKDSLIDTRLTSDSTLVSNFVVQNSTDISLPLLKNKINELMEEDKIGKTNVSKTGGYYSRTKFEAALVNGKSTKSNDSIAEYIDNNWNINYNKHSDIFNAKYYGELEVFMSSRNTAQLGNIKIGTDYLKTSKWLTGANTKVTESETIYVPEPKKNSDFKVYSNTEYRQGFNSFNEFKSVNTDKASVYQGLGTSYQYKRHGIGLEANYRILGDDVLPKSEFKIKYNFYIVK